MVSMNFDSSRRTPRLAAWLAVSAALLMPLAASAQNVAIVNGKAVPKSRVEALLVQATSQGQPRTPELEAQVRDEVVLREMFMQEAERQGLAASAQYKSQMELARQSILIRELFTEYQKKNPVTDADIAAEYEKFKAQSRSPPFSPDPGSLECFFASSSKLAPPLICTISALA